MRASGHNDIHVMNMYIFTCESFGTVRLSTLKRLCVRDDMTALAPPGGAIAQMSCVSRMYLQAHLARSYL